MVKVRYEVLSSRWSSIVPQCATMVHPARCVFAGPSDLNCESSGGRSRARH